MADGAWVAPPALRAALASEAWVEAVLAYEAVLASAQAERGSIPTAHAERIAAVCAEPGALAISGDDPVPSIVAAVREAVGAGADAAVHRGARERDAADAASALVARRAAALIDADLEAVQRRLAGAAAGDVAEARTLLGAVLFSVRADADVVALVGAGLGLPPGDGDLSSLAAALERTAEAVEGVGPGPHADAARAARHQTAELTAVTAWRRGWPLLAGALLATGAAAAHLRAGLREARIVPPQ